MNKSFLYEFENNYTYEMMFDFYKNLRKNNLITGIMFLVLGIFIILTGLVVQPKYFFIVFGCVLSFFGLIILLMILVLKNNFKAQILSGFAESKQFIKIFDDHIFIHHLIKNSESRENIPWSNFSEFKETPITLIMTIQHKGAYLINKLEVNNEEVFTFIRNKMKENVKIFNGKFNKANKKKK